MPQTLAPFSTTPFFVVVIFEELLKDTPISYIKVLWLRIGLKFYSQGKSKNPNMELFNSVSP